MVVGGASGSWIWGGENVSVVANLHRATIVTISSRLDQEQRHGRHYCGRGLMACIWLSESVGHAPVYLGFDVASNYIS